MPHALLTPMLFGIKWLDPEWMLDQFGTGFFWVSLAIIVVECGLFFPFLPGDTLLVAIGIFLASGDLSIIPGPGLLDLLVGCLLLVGAAMLGNVLGFEIGSKLGPVIYEHDGKILKQSYFDRTEAFFDKHGRKSLVIGRFVPVVRTYVTVVAGASKMKRPRFLVWSLVGALLWVLSITGTGYFVGDSFPWLANHIDYLILGLLLLTIIPAAIHWWRERGSD
ncbi:VTT domain-containing protein [Nocardioides agariphilus]|jgi:membrane-associated protein|uniref:VTT domain-containing protein n=1 Tax=Nocardioides agariphilus TaxID=433664 RepID=A0A930VKB1_9ACTN|nr:VTT domain-containing protein [Nocardioides agariphilus]MBF4766191.1 VTT domain-containing protein [Nocardioides agariphilus]